MCHVYTDLDPIDQVGHMCTDYTDHQDHTKSKPYRSQRPPVYGTELDHTDQVDHTYTDYTLQIV